MEKPNLRDLKDVVKHAKAKDKFQVLIRVDTLEQIIEALEKLNNKGETQ